MLNLGCLERKNKKRTGDAERATVLFLGLGRDIGFLCRDRAFWLYVATNFSMS